MPDYPDTKADQMNWKALPVPLSGHMPRPDI